MRRAAAGLAIGFAVIAAPVHAAGGPVPVADFVRKAEFESAKVSPDGRYLAAAVPFGDQTGLGIIDLEKRVITGSLRFARGEHVAGFWWVGDGRVLVTIANRGGPLDQPRLTGELFAMDANGANKMYLFGYRGREQTGSRIRENTLQRAWAFRLAKLPGDEVLIRVRPFDNSDSALEFIERLDVRSGRRKRVAVIPAYSPQVAVDEAGRLLFAAGVDIDDRIRLFVPDAKSEWRRVEHPRGQLDRFAIHGSAADGSRIFVTAEAGGRECLEDYSPATARFREIACADGELGEPVLDLAGNAVIGILGGAGAPGFAVTDKTHPDAAFFQELLKGFAGQTVVVTSRTRDGRKVVLDVSSDRNPGEFFLLDRNTRRAEFLVARRSWIDPAAMAPVTPVRYATRDGASIEAYLTVSEGPSARGKPLILLPHGGPHGIRDYWEWDGWAQVLASRGYAVLQPNFRGSGGYGKAHERAGYRKWGTLMQDDLTDAVRWAVAQGIADPRRVCIFGASYGGYAALMSAVREPDLYRCAASFAGVYDLALQRRKSDIADHVLGRAYLDRVLGTDTELLAQQSPVTFVDRLKIPVLIAHGTRDARVPFDQATTLRDALEDRSKPFEWMEFRGEEHGFYEDANHEAFITRLLAFFEANLKPVPARP